MAALVSPEVGVETGKTFVLMSALSRVISDARSSKRDSDGPNLLLFLESNMLILLSHEGSDPTQDSPNIESNKSMLNHACLSSALGYLFTPHPRNHNYNNNNERLLTQLRTTAKNSKTIFSARDSFPYCQSIHTSDRAYHQR